MFSGKGMLDGSALHTVCGLGFLGEMRLVAGLG